MYTIYDVNTGCAAKRLDGSDLVVTTLAAALCIIARNPWLFFYELED